MRDKSLVVSVLALILTAAAATACSSDSSNPAADAGVVIPDAKLADAAPACTVPAQLALPAGTSVFHVAAVAPNPEFWALQGATGQPGGTAQFVGFNVDAPVAIGTPLDMTMGCTMTSAFCFSLLGNFTVNAMNQVDGDAYFATSGTVTITAAGAVGQPFTGTTSGVKFDHFKLNAAGTGLVPANDGCSATLADTNINFVVKAGKPGQDLGPLSLPAHFNR